MALSDKSRSASGNKFAQAKNFLAEARAERKRIDYGELFTIVHAPKARPKTVNFSLKPSTKAWMIASLPPGLTAMDSLLEGGKLKVDQFSLKPGLTDILHYGTKRPHKRSAYSFTLAGPDVMMQTAPGTGLPVSKTVEIEELVFGSAKMKGTGKPADVPLFKGKQVASVSIVGVGASAKASSRKECTCVLSLGGATRKFPGTTQAECMAAATLYGFNWKWECE